MLAVIAAGLFLVGFVLKLAGTSLGRLDALAFALLGLVFLAAQVASWRVGWWPTARRRVP